MAIPPRAGSAKHVVIGAGIAGLARALALADRGESPIIIDPKPPGGLIQSVIKDGFTLECGAATLVDTPEVRSLLRRLGLEGRMLFPKIPKFRQYLWYKGKARAVPRGPLQVFTSPLLPGMEKYRVLRGMLRKGAAASLGRAASIHDLFSAFLSPHIASSLLAPVLRGIFGGSTRMLVASAVFPKLWEFLEQGGSLAGYARKRSALGRRAVFRLSGGNSCLIERLVEALRGKAEFLSAEVSSMTFNEELREFSLALSDGERFTAKSISIATAGVATASFIGSLSPELSGELRKLRYAPIAVIHLEIDGKEPLLTNGFGVLFPENETGLLGILFSSMLFPETCPSGKGVVTVCLGGVGREDLATQQEETLINLAKDLLKQHLGVSKSRALHCARWERGIPQYEEGILEIHRKMAEIECRYPGISFIGADRGGVGVPARIEAAVNLPTG